MFYKAGEHHGLPHDPFKSCIVPRPIAWVSSIHPNGTINLAPFSFFNGLASDPPMVMIAFTGYHEHGGEKDTLHNIKTSGEFVINMVPLALKDAMNASTAPVGHEVNEMELAGLHAEDSTLVRPPRVREAPITATDRGRNSPSRACAAAPPAEPVAASRSCFGVMGTCSSSVRSLP